MRIQFRLRTAGNDLADHITGEIQLEKPIGGVNMNFQDRIPRDQAFVDPIGNADTGHRIEAAFPTVTE